MTSAVPIARTGMVMLSKWRCLIVSIALFGCGAEPDASGLVAHWKFGEGSGQSIRDSSGNGNDGTIVPAPAPDKIWGTGEFAGSISLSGEKNHFVRIPSSASLNNVKRQITVLAHIYPKELPRAFISVVQRQWREEVHPDQYYLGYGLDEEELKYKWHIGLAEDEEGIYRLPKGDKQPAVGEWVHLAGTYDGKTGKMSLYVNGKRIDTKTHIGEIRLDPESMNRPLVIGAEINGSNINESDGEFDGYIDDIRIYDRALSAKEIQSLANEATSRYN